MDNLQQGKGQKIQSTPLVHKILVMGLLEVADAIFKERNIKYFIDGGTLLGAMREGTMIDHDDDADIGVIDDWSKLMGTLDEFRRTVLSIQLQNDKLDFQIKVSESGDVIKIYIENIWQVMEAKDGLPERIVATPTLDIFRWKKKGDKIVLYGKANRLGFKGCWYYKDEMYPLKQYRLNQAWAGREIYVSGPKDGLPYLLRYYGEDCMTEIRYDNRNLDQPQAKTKIF